MTPEEFKSAMSEVLDSGRFQGRVEEKLGNIEKSQASALEAMLRMETRIDSKADAAHRRIDLIDNTRSGERGYMVGIAGGVVFVFWLLQTIAAWVAERVKTGGIQ